MEHSAHHNSHATAVEQHDPRARPAGWHALSHVVIRRTGFPFEWLGQLATPRAAACAKEIAERLADFEDATQILLRELFPAAVDEARRVGDRRLLSIYSKLRRKVGRRTLAQQDWSTWQAFLPASMAEACRQLCRRQQQLEALRAQAAAILEDELTASGRVLRRIAGDPYVQEAIFLSNPDLYANSLQPFLAQDDRPSDPAFARKLLLYIQRFCAKNDTASFFGPLNCGRIEAEQDQPIVIETAGDHYTRRDVFISFWVVKGLAEQISRDPAVRPFLRPRPHPLCAWEGTTVSFPLLGRRARLTPPQQRLLQLVDGQRAVADIATALGEEPAEATAEIAHLEATRVLICQLEIPSTIFHPFDDLLRQVAALPAACERRAYWLDHLAQFDDLRRQFVAAPLPERQRLLARMDQHFTELTGESPRRSAGATYADRTLIYEDCAGTYERFQVSRSFFEAFQARLTPILELCAAHGGLLWRHYQALGRAVFAACSPDGRPIPYAQFIAAMRRQQQSAPPAPSADLERFSDHFRRLVHQRSDGRVARITRDDIAELLGGLPPVHNCHISPDVMLIAPDLAALQRGNYQILLGEVHQVIYAWGSQLYFHPQREEAEAEMAAHIARMPEYRGLATVLNERQHKGLLSEVFPGPFIEIAAVPAPGHPHIPLTELDVALVDERLVLRVRRTGQELRLYTAGDEQLHLWALAVPRVMPIPVRMEGHTPRIEIDDCVYQRERWQLPAACWADLEDLGPLDLLIRAQQVARRYQLPQQVFVHVASEPKPCYLDFTNPTSLQLLQQFCRVNDTLTFAETLPGADQLWLEEHHQHYCCEFRMTLCRYP